MLRVSDSSRKSDLVRKEKDVVAKTEEKTIKSDKNPRNIHQAESSGYIEKSKATEHKLTDDREIHENLNGKEGKKLSDRSINSKDTDQSNLAPTGATGIKDKLAPEDIKATIVKKAGSRNISIFKKTDGYYELHLDRPEIKRLVFSGGGSKGLSYVGSVKSLEKTGKLDKVESCFGSSAGALQASLIAMGATAEEVKQYSDKMEMGKLLKQENDFYDRNNIPIVGDKDTSRLGKIRALWDTIVRLFRKQNSVGAKYEAYINYVTAKVLLARIKESDVLLEDSLQDIIKKLKIQEKDPRELGDTINFNDLDRLSKFIPKIKNLTVTGTANIKGKYQLLLYNKDSFAATPISHAVRISSSLPLVFPEVPQNNFLGTDEDIKLIDGGCIMNTPDPGVIHRTFESEYKKDESLIFVFDKKTDIKKSKSSSERFVKIPATMLKAEGRRLRTDYKDQTVEIPVSTFYGKKRVALSTVSFFVPPKHIDAIQQESEKKVLEYLNNRTNKQQKYNFRDLDSLLNSLGDTELAAIEKEKPGTCIDIIEMRKLAKETIDNIKTEVYKYDCDDSPKDKKIYAMINELTKLSRHIQDKPEFISWFSSFINDSEDPQLNRFIDLTRGEIKPNSSDFIAFNAIHSERARREHRANVFYVIREHIYPVLYGSKLSKKNKNLIIQGISDVLKTSTTDELKETMKKLQQDYNKIADKETDYFSISYLNHYLKSSTPKPMDDISGIV